MVIKKKAKKKSKGIKGRSDAWTLDGGGKHEGKKEFVDEDGKKIQIDRWFTSGKAPAALRTTASHIENCIKGVTVGYEYKMRFVYAHFPINFTIDKSGQKCEIRNFLGEKVVRKVDALEGVKVVRSSDVKDEIVVSGNSIENVSKTCALISMVCTVKNKDIRKFLDGIYVSKKGHIVKD